MPGRVHALVQDADDLNLARRDHPVEEDVHWLSDRRANGTGARVAQMKAAHAGNQVGLIEGGKPLRIG